MPRRRWSEEDGVLALDLYFRAPPPAPENEVAKTALLAGCLPADVHARLTHFHNLHFPETAAGATAQLSRKVWGEYCHDEKWRRRGDNYAAVFGGACKDRARLRRDALAIIKNRTPPAKISRREARQEAMRVLYAAQLQNISAAEALRQMQNCQSSAREKMLLADSFLHLIAAAADSRRETAAALIAAAAGRAPELISGVERAALFAAAAELLECPQTDSAVVINEAVEIAKQFGAEDGHKLVNGVLDAVAEQIKRGAAGA
ncbi:MAG: transcription antitermination factor NusB [Gammaproteobacteria bacterium]